MGKRTSVKPKYNSLTIVKEIHEPGTPIKVLCVCDCGKYKEVWKNNLVAGRTKSCGCQRKGVNKKYNEYFVKDRVAYVKATNTQSVFMVDADKWEEIKTISWYESKNGYIQHKDKGKDYSYIHRVLTKADSGMVVDHINHNKLDNRLANLRVCSYLANSLNPAKLPHGIHPIKRGENTYFVVQLKGFGKKYRGCFKTYEEAKEIRDKIIEEEYGVKGVKR